MNSRTIDVVTDWETVAAPDGYEGLHQLADREFSGAVSAGTTWAFFLNGRVVGVFEGDIGDFEDTAVTAYRAADPSLPLLFAMQERGGDTRARYYTNETPLSDVDQTLSSGGFTGYIELSENVLSGDYYVVYHGGKSMSAAFVGNSERLITGEEAFETADDEVGIYEVVDVDVELVDIPEPSTPDETEDEDAADSEPTGDTSDADPTVAAAEATDETADLAAGSEPDPEPPGQSDPEALGESDPEALGESDPEAPGESDPEAPGGEDTAITDEPIGAAESAEGVAMGESETDAEPDPTGTESGSEPTASTAAGEKTDETAADTASRDTAADESDAHETAARETGTETADDGASPADSASEAATDGEPTVNTTTESDTVGGAADEPHQNSETAASAAAESESGPTPDPQTRDGETGASEHSGRATNPVSESPTGPARSGPGAARTEEERWRNARTIPSLDPDRSSDRHPPDEQADSEGDRQSARERAAQMQRERTARRAARDGTDGSPGGDTAGDPSRAGGRRDDTAEDVERLRRRLERARDRIESLEAERDELEAERETLREEREEYRERIEELDAERQEYQDRVEELESECETLRSQVERLESEVESAGDGAADAQTTSMSPDQALSGTNLFVRYDRKGEATLKHAHAGEASREDVVENLRLEHHTTFETEGVVVDDQPYEEFLRESTEYAFAEWVVSDLLYEIGETGNRTGLAGVFDVIPDIDRIELYGTVGVETDDGVERRDFDVICRDKMGDPLFVADINASRNATTESMVGSLVENTGIVAEHEETLAAGFYVTESFYEPGALETVAEETGGGILSRSSKRSYVKLSRKRGYHLCLVEARDGEFHLNVPDL